MRSIIEAFDITRLRAGIAEMMVFSTEINADWARKRGWTVVPAESGGRFFPEDIGRIVDALHRSGVEKCLLVATENLGDLPPCYELDVSEEDFVELNRTLGTFRFVLTDQDRKWAIACNEWYNLFAGDTRLVSALLGKSADEACTEFLEMVLKLARGNPGEPLLQVARHYAAL